MGSCKHVGKYLPCLQVNSGVSTGHSGQDSNSYMLPPEMAHLGISWNENYLRGRRRTKASPRRGDPLSSPPQEEVTYLAWELIHIEVCFLIEDKVSRVKGRDLPFLRNLVISGNQTSSVEDSHIKMGISLWRVSHFRGSSSTQTRQVKGQHLTITLINHSRQKAGDPHASVCILTPICNIYIRRTSQPLEILFPRGSCCRADVCKSFSLSVMN